MVKSFLIFSFHRLRGMGLGVCGLFFRRTSSLNSKSSSSPRASGSMDFTSDKATRLAQ